MSDGAGAERKPTTRKFRAVVVHEIVVESSVRIGADDLADFLEGGEDPCAYGASWVQIEEAVVQEVTYERSNRG